MVTAKVVCAGCGASLTEGDLYCPRCGTAVGQSLRRCRVCGHDNPSTQDICESCGAKLAVAGTGAARNRIVDRKAKKGQRRIVAHHGREPWQYFAGVVIVGLLGFFIFTELNREAPSAPAPGQDESPAVVAARTQEIEQLQKVVEANPGDATSTLHLANLLHDDGSRNPQSIVRAVEIYKQYLAMNPDNPDARVDLGVCYFELGRRDTARSQEYFASAAKEMETAYQAHPTHQAAAFNLGIVNLHAGDLGAASKWFKRAVEINPSSTLGVRAKQLLDEHTVQGPSN